MDAPRNVRCFVLCDFEVELVAEQAIFRAVGWSTRRGLKLRELCFVDVGPELRGPVEDEGEGGRGKVCVVALIAGDDAERISSWQMAASLGRYFGIARCQRFIEESVGQGFLRET